MYKMEKQHVCPVWLGYAFLLPIRKYQHNPQKILGPHIKEGMTVMDYGCAMGYFSIPLAQMTGAKGKVYCVDMQEKMLAKLQKRAVKYNVSDVIKPLQVGKGFNPGELSDKLDFLLLFAVAHEVPDKKQLFHDLYKMLKPGGRILFAEPKGHVKPADFEKSLQLAKEAGLTVSDEKPMPKGLNIFLVK
jgi:2-polyprenyl-3-methyl-5-hydroxy-6-metoxy-1,4-benzoquinol methylase